MRSSPLERSSWVRADVSTALSSLERWSCLARRRDHCHHYAGCPGLLKATDLEVRTPPRLATVLDGADDLNGLGRADDRFFRAVEIHNCKRGTTRSTPGAVPRVAPYSPASNSPCFSRRNALRCMV